MGDNDALQLARLLLEASRDSGTPCNPERLGESLLAAVEGAQRAWPDLRISSSEFVAYLAERLAGDDDIEGSLARSRVDDLWLVFGCLQRDSSAIAEFEKCFVQVATSVAGRLRLQATETEELLQEIRVALMVGGENKPPLLQQFRGEGPLGGWLRMVLMRQGLRFRDAQRRVLPQEDELIERLSLDVSDPELSYIKELYLDEFRTAFKAAVKALGSEERNTLRYYVIKGLNAEQIAAIYRVNRSTVIRRIVKIRENLFEETQRRLAELIDTDDLEARSVIQLLASRMEITLGNALATDGEPDPAAW